MGDTITPEQHKAILREAMLRGPARAFDLLKSVPDLLKRRGWPDDQALADVVTAAVSLWVVGARGTVIRRPPAADGCGGKWPANQYRVKVSWLFEALELKELLP